MADSSRDSYRYVPISRRNIQFPLAVASGIWLVGSTQGHVDCFRWADLRSETHRALPGSGLFNELEGKDAAWN